jgi:hypothetical protein
LLGGGDQAGEGPGVLRGVLAPEGLGQALREDVNDACVQIQRVPEEEQTLTGWLTVTMVATE